MIFKISSYISIQSWQHGKCSFVLTDISEFFFSTTLFSSLNVYGLHLSALFAPLLVSLVQSQRQNGRLTEKRGRVQSRSDWLQNGSVPVQVREVQRASGIHKQEA